MIQDLKAQHLRTVVITDLHIADVPNAGYKPYDEGMAGDHFVRNPDGSTFVGVVWPGKSMFPILRRRLRASGGERSTAISSPRELPGSGTT